MTATRALEAAREAGIEIGLDGADLLLTAASKPRGDVLDALLHHKAEIVVLLRADKDRWSAEDWRAYFDERAGIAESVAACRGQKLRPKRLSAALWNG